MTEMCAGAGATGATSGPSRFWQRLLMVISMAALVWSAAARAFGPSDLWDQTQPRTVSYTADILAHGRWILPIERGELPATKPPLYNWIAAPAVYLLGSTSEVAHKLPSLFALAGCWLLLVKIGRTSIFHGNWSEAVGWVAGIAFVGNYLIFKLGYLARPDMLLTFWLLLGWWSATRVLIREPNERDDSSDLLWVVVFWMCFSLALLTKGPAALVLLLYAIIAARIIVERWGAIHRFRWWWGLPISILPFAAWVIGVGLIDPGHLREKLWFDEIVGRVSGVGPEGARGGPKELLTSAPNMIWYYLLRFAPWSVVSVLAVIVLLRRDRKGEPRRWRSLGPAGGALAGAALFTIVVIAMYSFSAGKRADYVAAAFGTGSLLAGWLIARRLAARATITGWLTLTASVVTLAVMTWQLERDAAAPVPGFGDAIRRFAREAHERLASKPAPVVLCWTGETHLQALLGLSEKDRGREAVLEMIERGSPFWVIAGRNDTRTPEIDEWLAKREIDVSMTAVIRSEHLPRAHGWPERLSLFLAEP